MDTAAGGVTRRAPGGSSQPFRTDIQALRGLAILLVLLYHAELIGPLRAGYLGVDIFFTVSGYLITGIVVRDLRAGVFSFTAFYARRAKRLLPAAYVTFLATSLLAVFFLTPPEMRDYSRQLLGAVTFTGNIVLWLQTGYFESAAHLKPLLHVWSLSIEEQYYLLLPAALVFTPRRLWMAGVWLVLLISLGLCLILVDVKPGATFYLLPTRAWELALGSLGALVVEGSRVQSWLGRLFWPALAVLLVLPVWPTGMPHPGWDALLIGCATLIVILRGHPVLDRIWPVRALARLGDISYSLYLVHWPLLAFAANAWLTPIPWTVRLDLVVLALVLGWALYRGVERPVRRAQVPINAMALGLTLASSCGLVLVGFGLQDFDRWGDQVDPSALQRANPGHCIAFENNDPFSPKPECQSGERPSLMVWGDSYAMHLVPGINATSNRGIIQATKTTCGPLLGISHYRMDNFYNRTWGLGCLRFNRSVVEYLASPAGQDIQVVVMSSFFNQYLGGQVLIEPPCNPGDGVCPPPVDGVGGEELAVHALLDAVAAIRALGKHPVLVAPPPVASFDVGRCLIRQALGKLTFGAPDGLCAIPEEPYRIQRADVLNLLARVAWEGKVPLFKMDAYLCHAGTCAAELDGTFLYVDHGHLTTEGSRLLGRKLDLTNLLLNMALKPNRPE